MPTSPVPHPSLSLEEIGRRERVIREVVGGLHQRPVPVWEALLLHVPPEVWDQLLPHIRWALWKTTGGLMGPPSEEYGPTRMHKVGVDR